jgi:excinuclease UvrABC helicase subunit UvrB
MEITKDKLPAQIPVYLPDEEVKKFMVFQEFYVPIVLMIESDVFKQKNATILLDFDKLGVLRSIRREDMLYTSRT